MGSTSCWRVCSVGPIRRMTSWARATTAAGRPGAASCRSADATGPQPSPEVQALADEPEDAYVKRTFEEYIAARKQTNEGSDGLTLEGFAQKLKQNEAALMKKHGARMVRFKVVIKNGQTTLKPFPIQ